MLDLQTQIRRRHTNAIERRIAEQDAMPLEYVGVFHRENVRRGFPLARREGQRRMIAILCPRLRHRRHRAQPFERQRIHDHQHVVIGLLRIVLAGHRRAEQHHRAKPAPVRKLKLPHQFVEFHHRPPPLPARAAATTTESAATTKPTEPSTAATKSAEASTAPAAATPPTPSTAKGPGGNHNRNWEAAGSASSPRRRKLPSTIRMIMKMINSTGSGIPPPLVDGY